MSHVLFSFVFLSSGFCLVLALAARVCYCLCFVLVCLEFQIIRFVISNFTPTFFIEISFVLPPPPQPIQPNYGQVTSKGPRQFVADIARSISLFVLRTYDGGGGGMKEEFMKRNKK